MLLIGSQGFVNLFLSLLFVFLKVKRNIRLLVIPTSDVGEETRALNKDKRNVIKALRRNGLFLAQYLEVKILKIELVVSIHTKIFSILFSQYEEVS